MIDKIKIMNDSFDPEFILQSLRWKDVEIENEPFKKHKKAMLYNSFSDGRRIMGLGVLLTENTKTKTYSVSVQGSIRKWYYKSNSRKDLKYIEFVHCIRLLEKKLGIKKNNIWESFKITVLEVGVTLLLKSDFHNVINCFVKYRNAERDNKHETTVYFKFQNYEILLYDKFSEMNRHPIWSKKENNVFDKFHFLRFEISITKISGTSFRKDFSNLALLKTNWDKLPKILETYLQKIEFVDLLSPQKNVIPKSNSQWIKKMIFLGIKSIGIDKAIEEFNNIEITNNKSKYFSDNISIYKSHISSKRDYRGEILLALKKKTDRLV